MKTLENNHQRFFRLVKHNSSDGREVRASASGAINSGFILSRVKSMTLKLLFTAFLLDNQQQKYGVENKPKSLPVVPLEKTLSRIPLSSSGTKVAGNS